MSQKANILFLTTQLPYPPNSGGTIKSFKLIEYFAKSHHLYVAAPLKEGEEKSISQFVQRVKLKAYYFKPLNRKRSLGSLLQSYIRSASLNVYRNYSEQIQQKVNSWLEDIDVIIVDHYEMGAYVPDAFKGKVILHAHNAEYVLWQRLAKVLPRSIKKAAVLAEVSRIKRAEKKYGFRANMIWAAPNDIKKLNALGLSFSKFQATYHLGDDQLLLKPELQFNAKNKTLLFVGTLSWEANIQGLLWFIEKVFPLLLKQEKEVQLMVVGKNPDMRLLNAAARYSQILFKGFVEDLEQVYQKASVAIAPLTFGSGMKVKVLEAMYRGIPMVTTSVGIEGIEHANDCVAVADDPKEFAEHCLTLLNDQKNWKQHASVSREVAHQRYLWSDLLEKHNEQLNGLLEKQNSLSPLAE